MNRFSYYPPILAYHRVGAHQRDHVPTVSSEAFELQLSFLARRRYRVVGLEDVVDGLIRGARLPRRMAAITFDDGYAETSTIAWPLLKRFGFPATVFVSTDEVGRPGFATWEQVAAMAKEGMTIGSHTIHHSYVPLVSSERLPAELAESKRTIEERLGRPVRFLSYPIGGYTPEAQAVARQAGYLAACTTNRAASRNGIDPFALRRVKVTDRDANLWLFRVKLSGYYDAFRQLKPPS